ncbi:MAG TPA: DUF4304 domain-containing protein [Candidatus Melainabacteria bacterium]|nr:DUF4304 domain-containing protein [Candidatus Melainabacteria bacterium]
MLRRFHPPLTHVVEIDSWKYGGGFYINMGVHLDSMRSPISKQSIAPDEVEEPNCLFRMRLRVQGWDDPKDVSELPEYLENLKQFWNEHGKTFLSSYKYPETFEEMISGADFRKLSTRELLDYALIAIHIGRYQDAFNLSHQIIDRLGVAQQFKSDARLIADIAKSRGAIDPAELRAKLEWPK